MFGKNQRLPQTHTPFHLFVREIFHTLQGEGPLVGTPAIFVRLAGCNLGCWFCDTDFEVQGGSTPVDVLVKRIMALANPVKCKLVVLTGGEPFRQDTTELVKQLNSLYVRVQVETAGTVMPPSAELYLSRRSDVQNTIVCSPKTPRLHPEIIPFISHYKYIIRAGEVDPADGLPSMSTQVKGNQQRLFRPWDHPASESLVTMDRTRIMVQPMEEYEPSLTAATVKSKLRTDINVAVAKEICLRHGYRLSLQTHKLLGLR